MERDMAPDPVQTDDASYVRLLLAHGVFSSPELSRSKYVMRHGGQMIRRVA